MEKVVQEYISVNNIRHDELHLHIDAIDKRFMASAARNGAESAVIENMKSMWNNDLPEDGSRDHQRYTLNTIGQMVYEGGVSNPMGGALSDFTGPSTVMQVTIANVIMVNRPEMENSQAVMLAKAAEIASLALGAVGVAAVASGVQTVMSNLGVVGFSVSLIATIVSVLILRRAEPPLPPPAVELSHYETIHENHKETREQFILRHCERVNEKVAGYDVWNASMEREGTTKKDTPNTVGWGSQSGNMWSRMEQVTGVFRGPYTFAGKDQYVMQGAVIAGDSKPLERVATRFKCIRCSALLKNGNRCRNVINYEDALEGIFCGTHKNKPNQPRVKMGEWAVDDNCDMPARLTGPASMKSVSDTNKLRF